MKSKSYATTASNFNKKKKNKFAEKLDHLSTQSSTYFITTTWTLYLLKCFNITNTIAKRQSYYCKNSCHYPQ